MHKTTVSLSRQERRQLQAIAGEARRALIRRARVILLKEGNLPTARISEEVGLSPGRVRYWLQQFKQHRMDIFPATSLAQEAGSEARSPRWFDFEGTEVAKQATEGEAGPPGAEVSLDDLCRTSGVDMAHARRVGEFALALFDEISDIHGLPAEQRSLLEAAATVHDIGLVEGRKRHHKVGRDRLLRHSLTGFDENATRILAFTTALHRKRYRKGRAAKQAAAVGLPEGLFEIALVLSALLRIADGLDYSGSQTTSLGEPSQADGTMVFPLSGPFAHEDGRRAQRKADLWRSLFGVGIRFTLESDGGITTEQTPPVRTIPDRSDRPKRPGIEANDLMSEAGRKVMRLHYDRMLDHEAGTRIGEDTEELHDMRVAVRRMRSAILVFGPYLMKGIANPLRRRLRRIGRALNRVRDLDVFMERLEEDLSAGFSLDPVGIQPLRRCWQLELAEARQGMLSFLDSTRYQDSVRTLANFLQLEAAGGTFPQEADSEPPRVSQCAADAVDERVQVLQGYGDSLEGASLGTLHSLRIDIKRFRYSLEFLREILSGEAEHAIQSAVELQDHLGALHDADVACKILVEFLNRWQSEEKREQTDIGGITRYLALKQSELQGLVSDFPSLWSNFLDPAMQRQLDRALERL